MIKKRDTCLYCGEKMESKTAKKKFCSDKCKVYWHRENKMINKVSTKAKSLGEDQKKKDDEQRSNPHWREGDPREGSNSFYLKFGSFTYNDENFKR